MTLVGKLLVFLNLVVSMGFMAWSLTLYTQRPDWFSATNDAGEKADPRFARLKTEITALEAAAKGAAKRWGGGLKDLEARETTRADRQKKLALRLEVARNGSPGFFEPTLRPDGLIDLDAAQTTPEKGPDDRPLAGANTLLNAFNENVTAIGTATEASEKLRVQTLDLGRQVQFRDEHLQRQLVLLDTIRTEVEYLGRFRINWDAQLDTVKRRKMQLDRRLEQLRDVKTDPGPKKPDGKAPGIEGMARAGR